MVLENARDAHEIANEILEMLRDLSEVDDVILYAEKAERDFDYWIEKGLSDA